MVVVVELAWGATGLHGGGRDGAVCCNDEGLARCLWLWQLVVEVALGGVLSPLDEDGVLLADPSERSWGLKLHQAKALLGPAGAGNVNTPRCRLPC
jgi:hypothetical protein